MEDLFIDQDPSSLDEAGKKLWFDTADFAARFKLQLEQALPEGRPAAAKAIGKELGGWIGAGWCHPDALRWIFRGEFILLLGVAAEAAAKAQLKPKTKKDRAKFDGLRQHEKLTGGDMDVVAHDSRHPQQIAQDAAEKLLSRYVPVVRDDVIHWTQPKWSEPCHGTSAQAWRAAYQSIGWRDGDHYRGAPGVDAAVFGLVHDQSLRVRAGGVGVVDGQWVDSPGLCESLGYYCTDDGARVEAWMKGEERAREEIERLFQHFPLTQPDASRRILSVIVTALSLHSFTGPVPAFLVKAHNPGDGKTLLAQACAQLVDGSVSLVPWVKDEDKFLESLLAELDGPARIVIVDNVKGTLGGAVIEALLTGTKIRGAQKFQNSRLYDCRRVFIFTGNDPIMTSDMARRLVPIDVDRAGHPTPPDLPNLLAEVEARRGQLLGACRAVIESAAGQGPEIPGCRSYEAWSRMVSGILGSDWRPIDAAALASESDPDVVLWRDLLEQIAEDSEGRSMAATDILAITGRGAWRGVLRGQQGDEATGIGRILHTMRGRVIAGHRIEVVQDQVFVGGQWRAKDKYLVTKVDTAPHTSPDVPF